MNREILHRLLDGVPDVDLPSVKRYLESLRGGAAIRAARLAPIDDEAVTPGDAAAMARTDEEIRNGNVSSHGDVLAEFMRS